MGNAKTYRRCAAQVERDDPEAARLLRRVADVME